MIIYNRDNISEFIKETDRLGGPDSTLAHVYWEKVKFNLSAGCN
jgi:hypothetical protein